MTTAPQWRISSRSGQGNNCVEVATNLDTVALLRDSKLSDHSPVLILPMAAFARFIEATKTDHFG